MWQQVFGIGVFAVLVIVALLAFLVALWLVAHVIVAALRLPRTVKRADPVAAIALLVALLLSPPFLGYVVAVLVALLDALPPIVQSLFISVQAIAAICAEKCTLATLDILGGSLASVVRELVAALKLAQFPPRSFILFLLIYAVLYFAYRLVWIPYRSHSTGEQPAIAQAPIVHVAFFVLVLFSFYLCLSALLAIPLLQPTPSVERFGVAELDKTIQADLPTPDDYDRRFPRGVAAFPVSQQADTFSASRVIFVERLRTNAGTLTELWSTTRNGVFASVLALRGKAVQNFGVNAARLGERERVDSYAAIYNWYQLERDRREQSLNDCRKDINAWIQNAASLVEGWRAVPQGDDPPISGGLATRDSSYPLFLSLQGTFDAVSQSCDIAQNTFNEPLPPRTQRGSSLGRIGNWTIWLLDTDSIPLVIIVGLVGFSLLGATISRVVRADGMESFRRLSFVDLLTVVAGGTTAALVIFLASYGGLSVVGGAKTDPDPYVVFIAVLLAAIYSEDVWLTVRARFLERLARAKEAEKSATEAQRQPQGAPRGNLPQQGPRI